MRRWLGGILILTAHMPNVIMVGLFDKQLNIHISWIQWLWLHLPIAGLFPIVYWILKFFFKFKNVEVSGGIERIETAKKELGKTKNYESGLFFSFLRLRRPCGHLRMSIRSRQE